MPSNKRREGQWDREQFKQGPDSSLHGLYHNNNQKTKKFNQITLGSVQFARPEPIYRQTTVDVQLTRGGEFTNVAWPGGQVNVDSTGLTAPASQQIHGLWEAPLPGQQVLIGFVEGAAGDPIVINKYPYNALQNPIFEAAHNQPLTQKGHSSLDVILGHFTGSWIALRGILPIPGHIDIESVSSLAITSEVSTTIKSVDVNLIANDSANVKLKNDGLISIFNTAEDMKTLMNDLFTALNNITTFGSPTNHVLSVSSKTEFNNLKTRFDNLYGGS